LALLASGLTSGALQLVECVVEETPEGSDFAACWSAVRYGCVGESGEEERHVSGGVGSGWFVDTCDEQSSRWLHMSSEDERFD
jgi:hypothetical protein